MDDLGNKISSIMSDPQALEQIKGIASMLGLGSTPKEESTPYTEDIQAVANQTVTSQSPLGGLDLSMLQGDTMETIMGIIPLLGEFNKEDDSKRLLLALKPFLGEERQKKVDEASKIISMIRLLPMLKTLNILG